MGFKSYPEMGAARQDAHPRACAAVDGSLNPAGQQAVKHHDPPAHVKLTTASMSVFDAALGRSFGNPAVAGV